MKSNLFEAGTKIIITSRHNVTEGVVSRTTKTQIIVQNHNGYERRFNKETLKEIGDHYTPYHGRATIRILTEKDIENKNREKQIEHLESMMRKFPLKYLNGDDLRSLSLMFEKLNDEYTEERDNGKKYWVNKHE